jgi:thioredoxin 1
MMKKMVFVLCIGLLAVMLQAATSSDETQKNSNTQKKEEKNAGDIKVTFIELGSVRCIPCKKMQPIMEEIKKEYKGQVQVIFYDVWTSEGKPYAYKYKIRLIPTQVFLDKDGKEYYRHEGFFPKDELVKVLKQKGVK